MRTPTATTPRSWPPSCSRSLEEHAPARAAGRGADRLTGTAAVGRRDGRRTRPRPRRCHPRRARGDRAGPRLLPGCRAGGPGGRRHRPCPDARRGPARGAPRRVGGWGRRSGAVAAQAFDWAPPATTAASPGCAAGSWPAARSAWAWARAHLEFVVDADEAPVLAARLGDARPARGVAPPTWPGRGDVEERRADPRRSCAASARRARSWRPSRGW